MKEMDLRGKKVFEILILLPSPHTQPPRYLINDFKCKDSKLSSSYLSIKSSNDFRSGLAADRTAASVPSCINFCFKSSCLVDNDMMMQSFPQVVD